MMASKSQIAKRQAFFFRCYRLFCTSGFANGQYPLIFTSLSFYPTLASTSTQILARDWFYFLPSPLFFLGGEGGIKSANQKWFIMGCNWFLLWISGHPKICVMGIGGGGGNAVNNMISSNVKGWCQFNFALAHLNALSFFFGGVSVIWVFIQFWDSSIPSPPL